MCVWVCSSGRERYVEWMGVGVRRVFSFLIVDIFFYFVVVVRVLPSRILDLT